MIKYEYYIVINRLIIMFYICMLNELSLLRKYDYMYFRLLIDVPLAILSSISVSTFTFQRLKSQYDRWQLMSTLEYKLTVLRFIIGNSIQPIIPNLTTCSFGKKCSHSSIYQPFLKRFSKFLKLHIAATVRFGALKNQENQEPSDITPKNLQ